MTQANLNVPFKWLEHGEGLDLPAVQSAGAAGIDLCAALAQDEILSLEPSTHIAVPCGFALALPQGFEAQIRPRSGLAFKHGVTVLNSPGTIDADYRGEIKILLINHGKEVFLIRRGDRIAQMVIASVVSAQFMPTFDLGETQRGVNGFGSTGLASKET